MKMSLKVSAVVSWFIGGFGILLSALVWVAHGALNAHNSYDKTEVIGSLLPPLLTLTIAGVVGFRSGSWIRSFPWIAPPILFATLSLVILIFGHGPQVHQR